MSECLDEEWTLKVPHLNLTERTSEEEIINMVRNQLRKPLIGGIATQSKVAGYSLWWNISLTIAVCYLLYKQRRVAPILLSAVQPANAQIIEGNHYIAFELIEVIILTLTLIGAVGITYLLGKKIYEFIQRRRQARTERNRANELMETEVAGTEGVLSLPRGRAFRVKVYSKEDEPFPDCGEY